MEYERETTKNRKVIQLRRIRKIEKLIRNDNSNWVKVKIGKQVLRVFTDSGSDAFVILPKLYKEEMGPIDKMKHVLRAYGGQKLDLRGIIKERVP